VGTRGSVPAAQPVRRVSRPAIREATSNDYERVSQLQVRNGLAPMPRESWMALWSENPLCRRMDRPWPIGWVLESDTDIVGFIAIITTAYRFRGRDPFSYTHMTLPKKRLV
jgi:hypothetical protein